MDGPHTFSPPEDEANRYRNSIFHHFITAILGAEPPKPPLRC